MNRKTLLVTFLIALLALPVLAQPPGRGHGDFLAKHQQMLVKQLDLTADQVTTLNKLTTDLKAQLAPLHAAGKATRTQLKAAFANGASPDPAEVGQLVITMHQNRQQAKAAMDSFHKSFEASLTPDQLTKLKALQASHPHPRFQNRAARGADPGER